MYVVVTRYHNIPADFTSSLWQSVDVNQRTEYLWQGRQTEEDSFIMLAVEQSLKKEEKTMETKKKERETVQQT
jgi:hypothetical protein